MVGRCPEVDGAPSAWAWVEALGQLAERLPPDDAGGGGAAAQPGVGDGRR